MKTRALLCSILTLAAVSLARAPVFAQPTAAVLESTEKAVKSAVLETNNKMIEAGNRMDVEGFFSYILDTNEGSIVQNGIRFKSREQAMQAIQQGHTGVAKIDRQFTNPQVTLISPDAALLVSEGTVNATLNDGRTIKGSFAVSLLFVRKEGQWKLLHGHYSMPVQ